MPITDAMLKVLYEAGYSVPTLVEHTGFTFHQIHYALKQQGADAAASREARLPYRTDRFTAIETPEDAYWLGFLAADAAMSEGVVGVALAPRDREQMVRFCSYMGAGEDRIHAMGRGIGVTLGHPPTAARLAEYGVGPRKSLTLQPPPLTDPALIAGYILGYMDGDGSVSVGKVREYRQLVVAFTAGGPDILRWIAAEVNRLIVPHAIPARDTKRGSCWDWRITGKKAATMLDHLYALGIPHLERKRAVFDAWRADRE